jgi:adenine-specific DNA-methyltransferase
VTALMASKGTGGRTRRPAARVVDNVRAEAGLHLHWEGRRLYRSRVPVPRVLEPEKKLSLGTEGQNLVIEGDNLQVMVSLRSQFNAAVDVAT